MNIQSNFDVLVVYNEKNATSASSNKKNNLDPFFLSGTRQHYTSAYAYFLKKCAEKKLSAAFTTSADIIGPGLCSNYWLYKNKKWQKIKKSAFAPIIFDKVSPLAKNLRKKRELLFSTTLSRPFNDNTLHLLFNDKLKTFKCLENFTIPTVNITKDTIHSSVLRLKALLAKHKMADDFSESFVVKDRFGAGGIAIHKIEENAETAILEILENAPRTSFILQPFAIFDKGYSHLKKQGYTDIRIIYSQGKIIQRYIRTAKESDFRCNEHQGGTVSYIKSSDIPKSVTVLSNEILKVLDYKNALFALDFIVSNNGNAYFLEGNINPGIYWGIGSQEDEINTKKLIRAIVNELKKRSNPITIDVTKPRLKLTSPVPIQVALA